MAIRFHSHKKQKCSKNNGSKEDNRQEMHDRYKGNIKGSEGDNLEMEYTFKYIIQSFVWKSS